MSKLLKLAAGSGANDGGLNDLPPHARLSLVDRRPISVLTGAAAAGVRPSRAADECHSDDSRSRSRASSAEPDDDDDDDPDRPRKVRRSRVRLRT